MTPRLVLLLLATMLIAACDAAPEPAPPPPSSGAPSSAAVLAGDPATWRLGLDQDLQPSTTSFTALVTRLDCNGGVTGTVLAPAIRRTATQVIVTFTVAAREPGAAPCNGNAAVASVVDLGEPLGDRPLIDGQCLPTAQGKTPAYCSGDPVRGKP